VCKGGRQSLKNGTRERVSCKSTGAPYKVGLGPAKDQDQTQRAEKKWNLHKPLNENRKQ